MKRLGAPLVLTLTALASLAEPMTDLGYFRTDGGPVLATAADGRTWVQSNRAVRRTVVFDHGIRSVSLRDLRTGQAVTAKAAPSITLVRPIMGQPATLAESWKMAPAEPPKGWERPAFDDRDWPTVSLPFSTQEEHRSWWFRRVLPDSPGKRMALLFDQSADDGAEVYADGVLIGTLSPADQPWTKVYRLNLPPNAKVVAIRLIGGGRPNGLANVRLVESGETRVLDLAHGWTLKSHKGDGRRLVLAMQGVGANAGFQVTAEFRAFPGEEPWFATKLSVTSNNKFEWLLGEARVDDWALPAADAKTASFTGSGFAAVDPRTGLGFATEMLHLQGSTEAKLGSAATVWRPYLPLAPKQTLDVPESFVGLFQGPVETGAFLVQLYVGKYVSHATPTTVPPVYNTWFGYYNGVNAEIVRKAIPLAAGIGAKAFVIDDGWQTNLTPLSGNYGDWVVNRKTFPDGIEPLSALAKQHGMRFGLWTAPIMVGNRAKVTTEHPAWLVQRADGTRLPLWESTSAMCLTGEWYQTFKARLLELCRLYGLGFLKLDGSLFVDGCVRTAHGHPASHSEGTQIEAWADLCATLRKQFPGIIIDRGWEGEPGVTAHQDTGWFGDWALAFHPEREADPAWWYKNADIYRNALYDLTMTRPTFTLSWETPCHVLSKPLDLNALEYHFTSVGAYLCNVEVHGRILEMTDEEAALVKKWVKWNWENRPWLAVAQPIVSLGKPYDPRDDKSVPHVDGVLHLRNALKGRYGYICLWNPGAGSQTSTVTVRPADSFVKMDTGKLRLVRLKDGKDMPHRRDDASFTVEVSMDPRSWEIIEVQAR